MSSIADKSGLVHLAQRHSCKIGSIYVDKMYSGTRKKTIEPSNIASATMLLAAGITEWSPSREKGSVSNIGKYQISPRGKTKCSTRIDIHRLRSLEPVMLRLARCSKEYHLHATMVDAWAVPIWDNWLRWSGLLKSRENEVRSRFSCGTLAG